MRLSNHLKKLALVASLILGATQFCKAALVAEYDFNNTLNSNGGALALVATDPLSANNFHNDTVFGNSQTVYRWDGNDFPTNEQAGLTFDSNGLLAVYNLYSMEMVVSLDSGSGWRRLIDVQNRQSDNGFYVDPNSTLNIFPASGSPNSFSANEYHHVVLVNNNSVLNAYLDGVLEISALNTTLMDINNGDNPGNLVHLFLDNVLAGGQGEFSDGDIALFRVYDSALSSDDVGRLFNDLQNEPVVPEPASLSLIGLGLAGFSAFRRRRNA